MAVKAMYALFVFVVGISRTLLLAVKTIASGVLSNNKLSFFAKCSGRLSGHRTARQLVGSSLRRHGDRQMQSDRRNVLRHVPGYGVERRTVRLFQRFRFLFLLIYLLLSI